MVMSESIEDRYEELSKLSGQKIDVVRQHMRRLSFKEYIDVMTALQKQDEAKIKEIFNPVLEYNMGGTLSPADMRASNGQATGTTQQKSSPTNPPAKQNQQQRTAAMGKLGTKNLGGVSASQTASAIGAAIDSKPLTPIQKQAMANQAAQVDALAQDPKTASQFRQLLNRLGK